MGCENLKALKAMFLTLHSWRPPWPSGSVQLWGGNPTGFLEGLAGTSSGQHTYSLNGPCQIMTNPQQNQFRFKTELFPLDHGIVKVFLGDLLSCVVVQSPQLGSAGP